MRAVVDTNVLVSGLLWHGTPHAFLEQVRAGALGLICSPALWAEFKAVIARPKFDLILARANISREDVLAQVRLLVEMIEPPPAAMSVSRDPDDDAVLALAVAAQVDLVVSGDDDLLALKSYQGIPIVTPAQAVAQIAK